MSNQHGEPTYSSIISPADYNACIAQHVYIDHADSVIAKVLTMLGITNVVELGCGPARILRQLAANGRRVIGVDHDPIFVSYAQHEVSSWKEPNIAVIEDDVSTMDFDRFGQKGFACVSEGFHHHVPKGTETSAYLQNVYRQLPQGGYYIVGDEFLPYYGTDAERLLRAMIWYSHVIASAQKAGHARLALEEAKTLLDDLAEGSGSEDQKSEQQVQMVLQLAQEVNRLAIVGEFHQAIALSKNFLTQLQELQGTSSSDPAMNLSRGDFKVCHEVFTNEVSAVGFKVVSVETVGPVLTIGGMSVYLLQK